MAKIEARLLKGFRDYLPNEEGPRLRMLDAVRRVFESFGFGPLQTPAIEYADILLGKYGDEGDKLLYRFLDNGERDVALRYDLTVPLARVVAQYGGELVLPFRRYHVAPVWRAEKPGKGRFREFMQCDVDIVGEPSARADAEIMTVGLEVLAALGVQAFVMRVNDRRILDGALDLVGVSARTARTAVLRAIDKLPKIGRTEVEKEIRTTVPLDAVAMDRLFALLGREVKGVEELDALRAELAGSEVGLAGVDGLRALLTMVAAAGYGERVAVDLSIARGLDYYTSTIYETFLVGYESFGSVMSGGRYDGLLDAFSGKVTPAVGISLGVDRLLAALTEAGLVTTRKSAGDVFLCVMDSERHADAMRIARAMRTAGLRVEVSLAGQKVGKQFQLATRKGYRFAALIGADEIAAGTVALKDLESGQQEVLALAAVAEWGPRFAT